MLLNYLITLLALTIERLYRIRYLHRGTHAVRSAEQLCRLLWVSLARPLSPNTSSPSASRRTAPPEANHHIPHPAIAFALGHILAKK